MRRNSAARESNALLSASRRTINGAALASFCLGFFRRIVFGILAPYCKSQYIISPVHFMSISSRSRRVRPMPAVVAATDNHALRIPAFKGTHVGSAVPQCQAATPAIRCVGLGAVQQQI